MVVTRNTYPAFTLSKSKITTWVLFLLPWVVLVVFVGVLYQGQLYNFESTILNTSGGADLRAHIAKIELIRQSLLKGGLWPHWSNSFYLGYAPFAHYPPLFYLLGGLVAIFTSATVGYKILILCNYILSAISLAFFIRRAIHLPVWLANWVGVFYATSSPLLLLHLYGSEPNLLSWNLALLTLTLYCWPQKRFDNYLAVFILILTILSHPFPVIFLILVLLVFAFIQGWINKNWRYEFMRLGLLFLPAAIFTSWWWLPAILTFNYLSPLSDSIVWQQLNTFYLIVVFVTALFFIFYEKNKNIFPPVILIGLLWSVVLSLLANHLIPAVGHFVHNSRFFNLGIITFSLPIIVSVLYNHRRQIISQSVIWVVTSIVGALLIITTAISFTNGELKLLTAESVNLLKNPEITELLSMIGDKRIIVSPRVGGLSLADSIVTYAPLYNFKSVTGPYSQGDPKFFDYTVHLEWEERWLFYDRTLVNLAGAAAADYILIRPPFIIPTHDKYKKIFSNSYGTLLDLKPSSKPVEVVTPALLAVSEESEARLITNIVNLLLPQGYKLPLVPASSVTLLDQKLFPLVVVTDPKLIDKYPYAQAYLVISQTIPEINDDRVRIYHLPLNLELIKKYFYAGPQYDYTKSVEFDIESIKNHSTAQLLTLISPTEKAWQHFVDDQLPAKPDQSIDKIWTENRDNFIKIGGGIGKFVLIRQSWWPYWQTKGGKLWRTSQGFMLVYLTTPELELKYLNTWDFIKVDIAHRILKIIPHD